MRKLALLLLLTGIGLPASAAKRVSVEELGQVLSTMHRMSDAKAAHQLSELELTERLNSVRLSHWVSDLRGAKARQALVMLADASGFLTLPKNEIPATAPPAVAAQKQLMALTIDYVTKTIRQLPNLFATREMIHFEDSPAGHRDDPMQSLVPYQPLHPISRSTDTVLYRDGQEVVDIGKAKRPKYEPNAHTLVTKGVFGPILGTTLSDAAHGTLVWGHWEQSAAGPQAVFRFVVPRENSHYEVQFCCVDGEHGAHEFKQLTGYHGEITVDPVNGTILRLTLEADMRPSDPVIRSDVAVEYGPVVIGGRTYICPLKSVSFELASRSPNYPKQAMLNDVVFSQYHLFRSESRVLTANDEDGSANSEARSNKGSEAIQESRSSGGEITESANVADKSEEVTPVAKVETVVPSGNAPVLTAAPEVSVTEVTSEPDVGVTLRVTTRLVDVGVMAMDKKGHPVFDLKPEDFEIYDNGRKEAVRFFGQAGGDLSKDAGHGQGDSEQPSGQLVFSNHRVDLAKAEAGSRGASGSVSILLIDVSSMAWSDLNYARSEMLKFLHTLPANQRVGLYVMKAQGFQVLEEGTVDHALLISKLREWMPNAQDLAQAKTTEVRNRQQIDEMHVDEMRGSSDLQFVYGDNGSAPELANPEDSKSYDSGNNSRRGTLASLMAVASHLAAVPGRKNLVWISSDNVLVDGPDQNADGSTAGKRIDGFVLRTQEALNDAQVSIYPLDASQVIPIAVDTSAKNTYVQVPAPGMKPSTANVQPYRDAQDLGVDKIGHLEANIQVDIRPIQASIQAMAAATGGRTFRRPDAIAADLASVVTDGGAAYLLGFTPDSPADDQYHSLTVKAAGRHDVLLHYREGYQYTKEPSTLKERFHEAMWQPLDVSDIAVNANVVAASAGATIKLNIATNDLALKQQDDRWMDRLDIFLMQREDDGVHAWVTGKTLSLAVKDATHEKLLQEGVSFDESVSGRQETGSVRIVVVDENSGQMGSVTVPAIALQEKH